MFLIGKTDYIHMATYTLVCCGLTVLTLFITLVYKYKTDRHDITEILLKVALNTITLTINISIMITFFTFYRYWVWPCHDSYFDYN